MLVDNASTDETPSLLYKLGIIDRLVPKDRAVRSFYLRVKFVDYALNILQNRDKKIEGFRWLVRG